MDNGSEKTYATLSNFRYAQVTKNLCGFKGNVSNDAYIPFNVDNAIKNGIIKAVKIC